jgi:hypothetical protein
VESAFPWFWFLSDRGRDRKDFGALATALRPAEAFNGFAACGGGGYGFCTTGIAIGVNYWCVDNASLLAEASATALRPAGSPNFLPFWGAPCSARNAAYLRVCLLSRALRDCYVLVGDVRRAPVVFLLRGGNR